jgi:diguanylate cyclase (GGDEF)-like protein
MSGSACNDSVFDVAASIGIFSDLDPSELDYVCGKMSMRKCAKDETLFREGDAGDELYIILEGSIAIIVRLADGKELVISEIACGNFFGEMSIVERAPRSATCRATEDSTFFALHADAFRALIVERPVIAMKITQRMLAISAQRLMKTGSLLSQMVLWGESARKRAVTDEATGLFNRRFMEDSIGGLFSKAKLSGSPFSIAMFDLDHFGDLNKKYGLDFGDRVIVAASRTFKSAFKPSDILVRYGGDEFTFLMPDTDSDQAFARCEGLCALIREVRLPDHDEARLSASLGVASYPEHADTLEELKEKADKALYRAKEGGRDRAMKPT